MRPKPPPEGKRNSPAPVPADRAHELRRRVQSLLGFAVKAGRVTPGFSLTRQGLLSGDVGFVLAARDLSPRRLEALIRASSERGVEVLVGWSQVELGSLLDRGPTGVVGISDAALARGMRARVAELAAGRVRAGGARPPVEGPTGRRKAAAELRDVTGRRPGRP